MKLLPYQVEPHAHLVKILSQQQAALDASDTGTGKTYTALFTAQTLNLPIGVVCPKAVIPSWERACASLGIKPLFILNLEKIRTGRTPWLKIDGRIYEWHVHGCLLIFDECHRCKSPKSQNAKTLVAAVRSNNKILCLSATAVQSPLDMRALGYALGLHKLHDFWKWAQAHGACENRWGAWEFRGPKEYLSLINQRIFPDNGVRVRIADLGSAFPENFIMPQEVAVANPKEIDGVYKEVQKAIEELDAKKKKDSTEPFVKLLRARQRAEVLKVPALVEMIEDLIEEGKSIAVFVNFDATVEALSERFMDASIVRGGQSNEERARNIADFQEDIARVIICNIQAGGVGISLHDIGGVFPRVSLICPSFSAVDFKQALGRIHRQGGKSPSIQKIIFAAGSVEAKVFKAVQSKINNIDTINDNDLAIVRINRTSPSGCLEGTGPTEN